MLNVCSSAACQRIWDSRRKSGFRRILALGVVCHILANFAMSGILLKISSMNYPGGIAMEQLHDLEFNGTNNDLRVHLDNLACQTGVSRFTQVNDNRWIYDKTENLALEEKLQSGKFSHLIAEINDQEAIVGKTMEDLATIEAFSKVTVDWNTFLPVIESKPALKIVKILSHNDGK